MWSDYKLGYFNFTPKTGSHAVDENAYCSEALNVVGGFKRRGKNIFSRVKCALNYFFPFSV